MKNGKIKRIFTLGIAGALAFSLLAGCGGGEISSSPSPSASQSSEAIEDKMFNVALTTPFTGFDPLRTNDQPSNYVCTQIYETLYRIDPVTGEYINLLAESAPQFSEDGLSATIKVREGITFHDGTPFNAEAVMHTFNLIKDPDFGSARASIAGSIDSMELLDEYTLKLNLKYEDGVLQAKLAHPNSSIVSPTAQQNQDLMVDPVGTGPYKFVSSISGSNVVLTRYDEYWGEAPAIKDITMTIIAEESTAIARMETGEADFMPSLSVEQISRVEGIEGVTVDTSDAAQIYYMILRADSSVNPIMADEEFRTALAMAVDKEGYVEYIMEDYATPAYSVIGPKITGYAPEAEEHNIAYDPEGVKAILDAHPGWADEEIKFLVASTPAYQKMGEYLQGKMKDAGFNNIQIEMIDYTAFLTEAKTDNRFDITMYAWANATRDGSELMEPNFHTVAGKNLARYAAEDRAAIDAYIDGSKTTSDMAVRTENLLGVNAILQDNAYIQPIYHAINLFCYNDAYTGVTRDPSGNFYLKDAKPAA